AGRAVARRGGVCRGLQLRDDHVAQGARPMSDEAKLSHIDERGAARMVDVSAKDDTERIAVAEGYVAMQPATLALIQEGGVPKGDVLAVARIAGIMAAKKTSDLVPMCHPLAITGVKVELAPAGDDRLRVEATVK